MKRISTESIKKSLQYRSDKDQLELLPDNFEFDTEPKPIKVLLKKLTYIFNDAGYETDIKSEKVLSKEVKRVSDLVKLLKGSPFKKIEWELWNDYFVNRNKEYVNVVDSVRTDKEDWNQENYVLSLTSEEDLDDKDLKEISKVLKIKTP